MKWNIIFHKKALSFVLAVFMLAANILPGQMPVAVWATEETEGSGLDFSDMWESNTCKTWLFTGGTEGVADFATSRTTRNWIGLFEDSLRDNATIFVEAGRCI